MQFVAAPQLEINQSTPTNTDVLLANNEKQSGYGRDFADVLNDSQKIEAQFAEVRKNRADQQRAAEAALANETRQPSNRQASNQQPPAAEHINPRSKEDQTVKSPHDDGKPVADSKQEQAASSGMENKGQPPANNDLPKKPINEDVNSIDAKQDKTINKSELNLADDNSDTAALLSLIESSKKANISANKVAKDDNGDQQAKQVLADKSVNSPADTTNLKTTEKGEAQSSAAESPEVSNKASNKVKEINTLDKNATEPASANNQLKQADDNLTGKFGKAEGKTEGKTEIETANKIRSSESSDVKKSTNPDSINSNDVSTKAIKLVTQNDSSSTAEQKDKSKQHSLTKLQDGSLIDKASKKADELNKQTSGKVVSGVQKGDVEQSLVNGQVKHDERVNHDKSQGNKANAEVKLDQSSQPIVSHQAEKPFAKATKSDNTGNDLQTKPIKLQQPAQQETNSANEQPVKTTAIDESNQAADLNIDADLQKSGQLSQAGSQLTSVEHKNGNVESNVNTESLTKSTTEKSTLSASSLADSGKVKNTQVDDKATVAENNKDKSQILVNAEAIQASQAAANVSKVENKNAEKSKSTKAKLTVDNVESKKAEVNSSVNLVEQKLDNESAFSQKGEGADARAINQTTTEKDVSEQSASKKQSKKSNGSSAATLNQNLQSKESVAEPKAEMASLAKNEPIQETAGLDFQIQNAALDRVAQDKATSNAAASNSAVQMQRAVEAAVQTERTQQKITNQLKDIPLNDKQAGADTINDNVKFMVSGRLQSAEIRLDPPELGSMQIKITMNGEQASVSMVVQNPQAKEMLDQAIPRLREMLENAGIQLGESNIEQQKQQTAGQQGEGRKGQGNRNNGDDGQVDDELLANEQKIVNGHVGEVDYYA
ncbi:hypothetical protein C2869_13415 [Saccharobesus litoralis]|uniref:Flagellar hook-length control protein-like C-terminal domain-containing protein n=1 Tax=Saccharobesus litoralis TaxID=2172099 RepID=A0A2S0VT36_9ALTE|nr:flagellar hook-length control protein FliK [Saccharobesus litoralis]AWB67374.1 hypothetical protein C2869_13415 [Saccharobesus litoralis]